MNHELQEALSPIFSKPVPDFMQELAVVQMLVACGTCICNGDPKAAIGEQWPAVANCFENGTISDPLLARIKLQQTYEMLARDMPKQSQDLQVIGVQKALEMELSLARN